MELPRIFSQRRDVEGLVVAIPAAVRIPSDRCQQSGSGLLSVVQSQLAQTLKPDHLLLCQLTLLDAFGDGGVVVVLLEK